MCDHTHPHHDPHPTHTDAARPRPGSSAPAAGSAPANPVREADADRGSVRTDDPYDPRTPGSAWREDARRTAAAARGAIALGVRRWRERRQWGRAVTLANLGELTAQWLEGHLDYLPGYASGGPDEETEDLVPVLAALNRAGCVTLGSQPGTRSPWWRQRAAVELAAEPAAAHRLAEAARAARLIVVQGRAGRRWRTDGRTVVTLWRDRDHTWFGTILSRRSLRDPVSGYGVCSRQAVTALYNAQQVTLIDPEWGRNDVLWPLLERFTATENQRRTAAEDG